MNRIKITVGVVTLILQATLVPLPAAMASVRLNDSQISQEAEAKFAADKVDKDAQVTVQDGVVTLSGTVNTIDQVERTGKSISKLTGVRAVNNNLRVASVPDERVAADAARQILRYPYYTIFDDVNVEAQDGKLVLSGQVLMPYRKSDIGALMKGVTGVQEIENNLEVLPISPDDDMIRLRVARAIFGDPSLYRYGLGVNPPIHIIVKNGNVRLTGVVRTTMDKQLAERAARFAALYFGFQNDLRVEGKMAEKG